MLPSICSDCRAHSEHWNGIDADDRARDANYGLQIWAASFSSAYTV
jgi:hypothetical protein